MKEDRLKEVGKIMRELFNDTFGVSGEEIIEITDSIDNIFHSHGYVISHDKISRFVVECIRRR